MGAYLKIYRPDGQPYCPEGQSDNIYSLSSLLTSDKTSITIGRTDPEGIFDVNTDIKLPQEDLKISRTHCVIEKRNNSYFSVKELETRSTHGTELYQVSSGDGKAIPVDCRGERLKSGDRILLKSNQGVDGSPYWAFCFFDDAETEKNLLPYPPEIKYHYKLGSGLSVYFNTQKRHYIQLDGQRFKLLDYMAQQSYQIKQDTHEKRIITYQEIILKIWPEESNFSSKKSEYVANIVSRIKARIAEQCNKNKEEIPGLFTNIPDIGYRLENCTIEQ
ncbi:MAG: FHA domain-containing protein [Microcystis aeruginosa F13-15]|nr:FHA domain-containing protein [Microcystis aeruginosa F13-15]